MSSNLDHGPRCVLFVPGDRSDMLEKAGGCDATGVMPDLEAAVAPSDKANARRCTRTAVEDLARCGYAVMPRVNRADSELIDADVAAVVTSGVSAIAVSNVADPSEVQRVHRLLDEAERAADLPAGGVKLVVFIESARGVVKAFDIAGASSRVAGLAMGAEDYCLDMGIARSADAGAQYARATVAMAARAAGCWALDSPCIRVDDREQVARESQSALALGYSGKLAIHPAQIGTINEVFSPTADDLARARRIVEAANMAARDGKAVTVLDGQMIDVPIVERARRILGSG